jgi:hypothetical protein
MVVHMVVLYCYEYGLLILYETFSKLAGICFRREHGCYTLGPLCLLEQFLERTFETARGTLSYRTIQARHYDQRVPFARLTKKTAAGSNVEARRLMKNLINAMQNCEYIRTPLWNL